MKLMLLTISLLFCTALLQAQKVSTLPPGRYETVIKNNGPWEKGDIVLLDDDHYQITSSHETGQYRFSQTAQRVFFTSGPLKGIYSKTTVSENLPAIIIPLSENEQLGLRLATSDIVGLLKKG